MQTSNFTTIILKADDGKYLTQADPETDILNRVIAETIAVGKYDSADNYVEIDAEQAEEYKRLQKEAYEAELAEEEAGE